jgi:uncharacterized protein YndB with AHSA1/START domain
MEKIQCAIHINASKEKIWSVLWDDSTYRKWTSVYAEGSHAVSDWKEGSKILFLSPEGDGMVSRIAVSKPGEFMSFEHLGMIKDGVEDTTSEKIKEWAGAMENYTLVQKDNGVTLTLDMHITDTYKDYFLQTSPKALELVKELAESN